MKSNQTATFLSNPSRGAGLILAGIISVAFGLRLWGIAFGLPHLYHYDEHFYVNTALKLGTGVFHTPPYAATGFSNLLFAEFGAVSYTHLDVYKRQACPSLQAWGRGAAALWAAGRNGGDLCRADDAERARGDSVAFLGADTAGARRCLRAGAGRRAAGGGTSSPPHAWAWAADRDSEKLSLSTK